MKTETHFYYCIDKVERQSHSIRIFGWAFSENGKTSISVKHDVPCEIQSVLRTDVVANFPDFDLEPEIGFDIYIKDMKIKMVHLDLFDGSEHFTVKVVCMKSYQKIKRMYEIGNYAVRNLSLHNLTKAVQVYQKDGWRGVYQKVLSKLRNNIDYPTWYRMHCPKKSELEEQRKTHFSYAPLISVIVPVFNPPKDFLQAMIDSVLAQTYENWELCLADGSSETEPWVILQEYASRDTRIHIKMIGENKGISGNSNEALEMAMGEYVVLFDHDDLLTPDALYEIVAVLNEMDPGYRADFLYSDEDKTGKDGKMFADPHFKPDFSPDMLRSTNYISHLTTISASLLSKAGRYFLSKYDGAQDYDLILRCTEQAEHIVHIPKVLYHWRVHDKSTAAGGGAKPYTHEAGKMALEAHLLRMGRKARVLDGVHGKAANIYKVEYDLLNEPLVSIIIPNYHHKDDLEKCIQSILNKTTYPHYEILIAENNSTEEEIFSYYRELEKNPSIKVCYWKDKFNYAAINNWAVRQANGEYFILMNNDIEIISRDWIQQLLMYAQWPEIGIVGAKLYYEDGTIQHGGVIVGLGGIACHAHVGFPRDAAGYFYRLCMVQNLSAVTAALMMVRRDAYESVNGMDTGFEVAFNDVDFCLRVREKGYLVVFNPDVEAWHYESKSRGDDNTPEKQRRFQGESKRFIERWTDGFVDPYYNVNLTLGKEDFSLRL